MLGQLLAFPIWIWLFFVWGTWSQGLSQSWMHLTPQSLHTFTLAAWLALTPAPAIAHLVGGERAELCRRPHSSLDTGLQLQQCVERDCEEASLSWTVKCSIPLHYVENGERTFSSFSFYDILTLKELYRYTDSHKVKIPPTYIPCVYPCPCVHMNSSQLLSPDILTSNYTKLRL